MTRRPRARRPPRLDDLEPRATPAPAPAPRRASGNRRTDARNLRRALIDARVAGPHARLGRAEVTAAVEHLVAGDPAAWLGRNAEPVTRDEVWAALRASWGWPAVGAEQANAPRNSHGANRSRAAIDPHATVAGLDAARARLGEVGAAGGRVAAVTGRPGSLRPLTRALLELAARSGAQVAGDGVGTDLEWLVAPDGPDLRPDVVVADGGLAAAALAAGHETIALADLDQPALGVAAARGAPVWVVPLDPSRPPAAYQALVERVAEHPPHSTTPAPGPYAAPRERGEG